MIFSRNRLQRQYQRKTSKICMLNPEENVEEVQVVIAETAKSPDLQDDCDP